MAWRIEKNSRRETERLTGSVTWSTETQSVFCKLNEGRGEVLCPLPCLFHVECGVVVPRGQRYRVGLWISGRRRSSAEAGLTGEGCHVTEFNMAGSDHTACCQHVQGVLLLILVRSAPQQVLKRRSKRGHRVFLLC